MKNIYFIHLLLIVLKIKVNNDKVGNEKERFQLGYNGMESETEA